MKQPVGIDVAEAVTLMNQESPREIYRTIFRADEVRAQYCGNRIATCAIINAKSGNCGENCAFCPQSVHAHSRIDKYPLKSSDELVAAAIRAETAGAQCFGIVTSGRRIAAPQEQAVIVEAVRRLHERGGIAACASLGVIDAAFMTALREAGLQRYHHNLEAAASYYPQICTTRTFADNVATLKLARDAGLKVCSGCLFGLGENNTQRVELLQSLRELGITSIPLNFLNPVPGTRLDGKTRPLRALECLKIIAVGRLMLPTAQLRVCGGREKNLRDMQSWIFAAGANALMIGSYLTYGDRDIPDDLQLIRDAGMCLYGDDNADDTGDGGGGEPTA
ncbi:MAG: biotin synthase BioB [Victivallales bacterium]|nr:biotin synthase BioB [Victivallales bacterium]